MSLRTPSLPLAFCVVGRQNHRIVGIEGHPVVHFLRLRGLAPVFIGLSHRRLIRGLCRRRLLLARVAPKNEEHTKKTHVLQFFHSRFLPKPWIGVP